jgi:YidC/Oxa1 family membrane protein insertase
VGVSWGWSIVLLTVVVRAVLIPLTLKQFRSMQKLQQVAPELKAIQAKYKQDKQRQQQEVMKFYKENEVNPFASCLPLVAQLPVFIGLFYMLRTSLRHDICPALNPLHAAHTVPCGPNGHAGFLFISDLTNTAKGATLVVLIVLYVGTQLASSLMMATPTMDQTQRRIMLLMPLFFVIFVINFPAGLIVYWITTNTWTMAQQYIVRKRIGPIVPATPAGPSDDGGGGGGGPGPTTPNGSSSGSGGLTGLLRGRLRPGDDNEPAAVGSSASSRARRGAPPPPPPRKKKKRSGRRR